MTKNDERWLENFNSFMEYIISNAKIPTNEFVESSNGTGLSAWFKNQRRNFKLGKLPEERVNLLNQIYNGILVKPIRDINKGLFACYKKFNFNKYDPDIVYLYRKRLISEDIFNSCIASKAYLLSQILERYRSSRKKQIHLLYSCMKDICNLPKLGICYLCTTVVTGTDLVDLYLEDKHKFVDYYSVVFRNFENDIELIIKDLKLPQKYIDVIDLYYGISSDKPLSLSMVDIGNMCGIEVSKVKAILARSLRKIMSKAVYDSNGKCTYRKPDLSFISDTGVDPYSMSIYELAGHGLFSVRAFNCLSRNNIHSFKELRDYLVSVYDGVSSNYVSGLLTIRNLGSRCAQEIYNIAKISGIEKKVFDIQ